MRVNVTVAARLTGRSEKTIRAWLAEEPCPLSVEWGQWRGGRRDGKIVRKGRTRLIDVDELRKLNEARYGHHWHPVFLPQVDATREQLLKENEELRQRVRDLEGEVARLRAGRLVERVPRPPVDPRPVNPPLPVTRPTERSTDGERETLPERAPKVATPAVVEDGHAGGGRAPAARAHAAPRAAGGGS